LTFSGSCAALRLSLLQPGHRVSSFGASGLTASGAVVPGRLTVRITKPRKTRRCHAAWRLVTTALVAEPPPTPAVAEVAVPAAATTGPPSFSGLSTAPIWVGDYETGTLGQFANTPWNYLPSAPTVTTTAQSGGYAGQYTIPAGGKRSENVINPDVSFREGDDLWFTYATWLNSDVPLHTTQWQVIGQWKNDGQGSPPLELCLANGRYKIGGGYGWPGTDAPTTPKLQERDLGPASANTWETWLVHVNFSSDPAKGTVNVWRNGTAMVTDWKPIGGTLYPGLFSYWKIGYYRSAVISQSSTVLVDNARLGTTRSSVGG
jgi:hypothetical protein